MRKFAVLGSRATDLSINAARRILAMSVADPFGTGYLRFFDLDDPEMDPPPGYGTVTFSGEELRGRPLDIQWQGDQLYVLLLRDGRLHLAILSGLDGPRSHAIHAIDRGLADDPDRVSLAVQYGQVAVTTADEYLILRPDAGGYRRCHVRS